MKKFLLLLLVLPLVLSCGKSVEDTASELAEKSSNLLSIRNFKSLFSKIEPLYNSVLFEDGVADSLYLIAALDSLKDEFQKEFDYLYEDSVTDRKYRGAAYKYKEPFRSLIYYKIGVDTLGFTMDDLKNRIADLDRSIDNIAIFIKDKYDKIDNSKQFGWRVIQKYSATNDIGSTYEDSLSFIMTGDTIWKNTISSVAEMDSSLAKLASHIEFATHRFNK